MGRGDWSFISEGCNTRFWFYRFFWMGACVCSCVCICMRACGGSSGRGRLKYVRVFGKRRDLLGFSYDVLASFYFDVFFLF